MSKYLSPKADITFKKVFGEHKNLTISFLNALLDFEDKAKIVSIEYQTPEMFPETPTRKYSIVDVRCKDDRGRSFIVEMQMVWNSDFKQRILHNTTRAYSNQLGQGKPFADAMPVYALCLIDDTFEPTLKSQPDDMLVRECSPYYGQDFYHHYMLTEDGHPDRIIEGLNIILVELPKFTPMSGSDKRMMALWLRFLTEIDEQTTVVPKEMLNSEEIKEALGIVERSVYTDAQILAYDKFWQDVDYSNHFDPDYHFGLGRSKGREEGLQEGLIEGRAKGLKEGLKEGERKGKMSIAKRLKDKGIPPEEIAEITGLSISEIAHL